MKADTDLALGTIDHRQAIDPRLHVGGGNETAVGVMEDTHDLVADGLDHPAAMAGGHSAHFDQGLVDHRLGRRIAQNVVQTGAAGDVSEQHGDRFFGRHAARQLRAVQRLGHARQVDEK